MKIGLTLSATLAAAMVTAPVTRAQADVIDFVAGAIVGTVLDHARRSQAAPQEIHRSTKTVEEPARARTARTTGNKSPRPELPATQEGRQVQAALNFFGFDAGPVDGQLGRKSRTAISAYQEYLGYPETGELSAFERELLVGSHQRAEGGGAAGSERMAIAGDEQRGLIKGMRDEMAERVMMASAPAANGAVSAIDAPSVALPPVLMASVMTPLSAGPAPDSGASGDSASPSSATRPRGQLVSLFGETERSTASLASHCSDVSLLTGTNGFITTSSLADPGPALSEQLCLARTYAIRKGEDLARGLTATPDRIAAHCAVYGEEMGAYVAELGRLDSSTIVEDVRDFTEGTGIPAAELAATATVCLSVGYRTDDMDMALGSALILTGLGESAFGELMGHHLALGFGAPARPELAASWYHMGLDAAEAGDAVFAPGQPERTALIRKASAELAGRSDDAAAVPQNAALPTFTNVD